MNESTKARLADALGLLPEVSPQTIAGAGSSAALEALQNNQADLGIVMADVAYRAYAGPTRGMSKRFDGLRGMAVLNINTIYLMANPLTGIQSIGDLRGHRIAIGSTGTATSAIAQLLLEASGLSLSQVKADVIPYTEALTLLTSGELDAAFLALNSSVQAAANNGATFVDVQGRLDRAAAPELPVSSNRHSCRRERSRASPKRCTRLEWIFCSACRSDLDQQLVYRIVKAYFEELQKQEPATDLERAPATPIPLHSGAARYYRERALSR